MVFPERFSNLPEYAFPRLRALLDGHTPGGDILHMTIGEPRHAWPQFVIDTIAAEAAGFGKYPPNEGTPELLQAIADWVRRRFNVRLDPSRQIMALNGTREGLFSAALALSPETKNGSKPVILTPNPFYQVYAVAALAAGATPHFVPATRETGYLPDFKGVAPDVLDRVTIAYVCSPSNPQGAVADKGYWADLIALAERHDFRIFSDECYSEVYRDTPPTGALEVARDLGTDPEGITIFHSLSKRSNVPGLRSGFVAGGEKSIARIRQLRNYAGAPLPLPLMRAAERLWADEDHVEASRARYVGKYKIADEVFSGVDGYQSPSAGFFLWLPVPDGEEAAMKLWTETGVRVLPGAYLSRDAEGGNPGKAYVRVALVADEEEMQRGLILIRDCLFR